MRSRVEAKNKARYYWFSLEKSSICALDVLSHMPCFLN